MIASRMENQIHKIDPLVFIPKAKKYHRVGEFLGPSHKLGKDYIPDK